MKQSTKQAASRAHGHGASGLHTATPEQLRALLLAITLVPGLWGLRVMTVT